MYVYLELIIEDLAVSEKGITRSEQMLFDVFVFLKGRESISGWE